MFQKISKSEARGLYEKEQEFYIVPCKCRPDSMFSQKVNGRTFELMIGWSFESFVNSFTYYNCNNECGRYPAYYVKG